MVQKTQNTCFGAAQSKSWLKSDLNKSLQTFDLQELQIKFLSLVGNYFFSQGTSLVGIDLFILIN